MKISNNENAAFTDIVKLTAADLIAIGTGNTKQIGLLPVGAAIELCGIINTVDIVGSSSLVVDIGYSGAATAFINAWDVDAATVGLPVYNTGTDFVQSAATTTFKGGALPVKPVSGATPILFKVTDAALASITAGEIVIGMRILDLGRFA
jgi:hypothetical protein